MQFEEMQAIFTQQLKSSLAAKKYSGRLTGDDEDRAVTAFKLVLENPTIPADLVFDILTRGHGS